MSKLELENQIFARAYRLGVVIHAREGALFSAAPDAKLQALIGVYNAFFRAENWAAFCAPQEDLQGWKIYLRQRTVAPGLTRIYHPKELNFELVLAGEK